MTRISHEEMYELLREARDWVDEAHPRTEENARKLLFGPGKQHWFDSHDLMNKRKWESETFFPDEEK